MEQPNDLRVISDIIVNTQTGTGNRIEFWNSMGTPLPSKGKIRRYIDIGHRGLDTVAFFCAKGNRIGNS